MAITRYYNDMVPFNVEDDRVFRASKVGGLTADQVLLVTSDGTIGQRTDVCMFSGSGNVNLGGTGDPGSRKLAVSGAMGVTGNAQVDGALRVGSGSFVGNETDGYLSVPVSSGAFSGTPASVGASAQLAVGLRDGVRRIYVNVGGTWFSASLASG